MSIPDPKQWYQQKTEDYKLLIIYWDRKTSILGRIRLLLFIFILIWIYAMWSYPAYIISTVVIFGGFLFLFLMKKSDFAASQVRLFNHFLSITRDELKILDGDFSFRKKGENYLDHYQLHNRNDLDLFGPGSLFQCFHRTRSDQGAAAFARSLMHPLSKENILARQGSIQELAIDPTWSQHLLALQGDAPVTDHMQSMLDHWIVQHKSEQIKPWVKIIRWILPMLSLSSVLLRWTHIISAEQFILFAILVLGIQGYIAKVTRNRFKQLNEISHELKSLLPCLQWIEKAIFKDPSLNELKNKILIPTPASHELGELSKLLGRYDYRLNFVVFIPLNFFTWFDLHLMNDLYRWTSKFAVKADHWFDTLAHFEMLGSYAILAFNHPHWIYPAISENWFHFKATSMAHPFMQPRKAVTNDFKMDDPNRIALINGSNMAGKSTFLRCIGTNWLLAQAGSPVCAQSFSFSPGNAMTSMRITDNLQEETSTFYAELKKLKEMIDAVNQGQKVILLIDEMLRGTNAEDRTLGSHSFVRQLIRHGAVAIIASHDVSISNFEKEYPGYIATYHFDSFIDQETLKFDYKLKPGISTSANASYLMKKMGIEINGDLSS